MLKRIGFKKKLPLTKGEPTIAEVVWADAPPEYHTSEALAEMPDAFKSVVRDLDLGQTINVVCPVLLASGTVMLLIVKDYLTSDVVDEVVKKVQRRKLDLARPWRAIASANVITGLVSGRVTAATLHHQERGTDESERSALQRTFREIVTWGLREGASDITLTVNFTRRTSQVRFTIRGRYVLPSEFAGIPTQQLNEMLAVAYQDIKGSAETGFEPTSEQQGRLELTINGEAIMLRWAQLACDDGPSVTLRILRLDQQVTTSLEDLGYLPSELAKFARAQNSEGGGIVLAGIMGSGKSTTIATQMSMIPHYRKVGTLEDPVEYRIPNALQNSISRPLTGEDQHSFDAKLKTIKRSAFQDLLIGEIRDYESGRAFMDLVVSGTSVYTTVHAYSAIGITDRLSGDLIKVSRELLSTPGVLKLLVYQALIPKLCPHCANPFTSLFVKGGPNGQGRWESGAYWQAYAQRLERLYRVEPDALRVRNEQGCERCAHPTAPALNGFVGRTVVSEMLEPTLSDDMLQAIRQNDGVRYRELFRAQRTADYLDPNMDGKTAMECAVYKASCGMLDPREIEPRFHSFETEEMSRADRSKPKDSAPRLVA